MSDSDSDDFFSDILALRQKIGLGDVATRPSPTVPANNTPASKAGSKRATEPVQSPAREPKRRSTTEFSVVSARPAVRAHVTGVSPAEIAALLSPRRQTQRAAGKRSSSGSDGKNYSMLATSAGQIPSRTPESRITSTRPTPSKSWSPRPTPTKSRSVASLPTTPKVLFNSLDSRRRSKGKESPLPDSRLSLSGAESQSASPSSALFDTRGLWDSVGAGLLQTPVRRHQQLVLSPVGLSKRPFRPVSNGLPLTEGNTYAASPLGNENGLLGSVEEALVTDADIDLAKRKLGEEQAITQQQIIRDIRERMMKFSLPGETATLGEHVWVESATILCQFYTLGHGKVSYSEEGIRWYGEALGPVATVAQWTADKDVDRLDSPAATVTMLLFPWARISGLRRKFIDEEEYIMFTANDDLGVAFEIGNLSVTAGAIGALVRDMAETMAQALGKELPLAPVVNSDDNGGAASEDAFLDDLNVARSLLWRAAKGECQLTDMDISKALDDRVFADTAVSMVRSLGNNLVAGALATLRR
ncbi:hypothetical protein EV174_005353, partial [Coemansia sp. RSA 2320]